MQIDRNDEGTVVRLPAQFYQSMSNSFIQTLKKEIDSGVTRIVVDFSDTALIDSSAIGALVSTSKESQSRGVSLCIRNLSGEIAELFLDTGLDKIFDIERGGKMHTAEIDIFEKTVDIRLDIKTEIAGDVCIFHLGGVMNHPQGSRYFKQQFLLAMVQYKKIMLELEDLTFFDSLSVSVILNMNKLIKETGGSLHICGANYIVNDLFNTLNLNRIISIYTTSAEALQDWT
jgi:anti-anti-sigma factor